MFTPEMWDSEKLTRMIRELQPGIVINNRASIPGDFDTPEQRIGTHQIRPWESCITLGSHWSYSPTPVKPKKTIIDMLTATAYGNGNLLISWGPKWDGVFDPAQEKRLMEVGDWLKKYGHTIYNTKGGPWYPDKWGGSTYYSNTAFIHITNQSGNELILPAIQNRVIKIQTVTGGDVSYIQNGESLTINLEKVKKEVESVILEVTFENDIVGMVSSTL